MPFGLRHVISGILAGGIPGLHGAVLLPSPACMALCVSVFPPFCFCYFYGHTMMR